ncbi:MAG: hypothetical protein TH68_05195 [Candidatus Synechococcus spongiarum 142]|uniref:Uncharacterized protein n=1 Tax=Candidatus Synechococcus spongiarum 142 TaxID=1608213 RepID=A0A6N3X8K1_9SYNE|nr:MAG: hypothetical protein TH68_05195 [Candidatus Synechococcus spongiarum 142]
MTKQVRECHVVMEGEWRDESFPGFPQTRFSQKRSMGERNHFFLSNFPWPRDHPELLIKRQ